MRSDCIIFLLLAEVVKVAASFVTGAAGAGTLAKGAGMPGGGIPDEGMGGAGLPGSCSSEKDCPDQEELNRILQNITGADAGKSEV